MEAGKAKQQQQQQQRERRTSNGIIIKVYEEAPPRPGANRPIQRRSRLGAPSSLAYDRRKMLLAYSQQLRQCHEQPTQGCCKIVHRPSWGQWKAAFLRNHGGMKKRNSLRRRTRAWIRRIMTRIRRRLREYSAIVPAAEHSPSCSCRGMWRCLLGRLSWLWRRRNGDRRFSGCRKALSCS
ncbi:unnamed protein product [Musa banksii]